MNKQCNCITSSQFPHPASKCALNVFSLGKQQTVQNSQENSSLGTISQVDRDAADLVNKVSVHVSAENCEIFVEDAENEEQQSNNNIVSTTSTRAVQCTCPTSVFFNHRASKCAIFGHPEPKPPQDVEAIVPIYLGDSAQSVEPETLLETPSSDTTLTTQAQNTTVKPAKAPGDMKCKCINSRLFPHRVKRCALLRARQSVENTVKGISQKTVRAVEELELALTNSYEDEFGSDEDLIGDEEDSPGSSGDFVRDVDNEEEEPDEYGEVLKRVHLRPTTTTTGSIMNSESDSGGSSSRGEVVVVNAINHHVNSQSHSTHTTHSSHTNTHNNQQHHHILQEERAQREKESEEQLGEENKKGEGEDFDDYIRL